MPRAVIFSALKESSAKMSALSGEQARSERLIRHSSPFSNSCRPSHFSKRNSAQPRITL